MPKWKNGLESEPVTTYVSEETKQAWKEHADNLDVSLSRFVEMMVNSGRTIYSDSAPKGFEETDPASAERRIKALENELRLRESDSKADTLQVYTELDDDYTSLDNLRERVEGDESMIYESLQLLVDEGLVEYDVMKNGYTKT